MKALSPRLDTFPTSPTMVLSERAGRLKQIGRDVIDLTVGEPDFDTPPHIVDAAVRAMHSGDTRYAAREQGALQEAIKEKLARENRISVESEQITITSGVKWALYLAVGALVEEGDEFLIPEPAWVSYAPIVRLQGGIPVSLPLDRHTGFRLTTERLERSLSPRVKALIVNSPNNPTGRVLTREEIEAIVQVALAHDLYVISDEIYEHILYDGARHRSVASEPGMGGRTITVSGFSKSYAMTGWRLGWLAAPLPIARHTRKLQSHTLTSATAFVVAGGVAALTGPQECVAEMVASYTERRAFMSAALNHIPGVECPPAEGAFYLFPHFSGTRKNSVEIAEALLEKASVAVNPGRAFGQAGEQQIRLSLTAPLHDLERAAERLARVIPTL